MGRPRGISARNVQRYHEWSELHVGGMTYEEIGAEYGVPWRSISSALRRYDLPRRVTTRSTSQSATMAGRVPVSDPIRDARIVYLATAEGARFKDIGLRYGITLERVRQILQKTGYKTGNVVRERKARRLAEQSSHPPVAGYDRPASGATP